MVIETERLILRKYTKDDLNDLFKLLSDPITMQHYPKPYDFDGAQRWLDWCLRSYEEDGFGLWAMILKSENKFIGDCGLSMQNIDGEKLPEIGYHINKEYWLKGYGKEAANAVKVWAFNNTNYTTLYSYMTKDNIASYKTAESIGMKRVKEYIDGEEILLVYSISKN